MVVADSPEWTCLISHVCNEETPNPRPAVSSNICGSQNWDLQSPINCTLKTSAFTGQTNLLSDPTIATKCSFSWAQTLHNYIFYPGILDPNGNPAVK